MSASQGSSSSTTAFRVKWFPAHQPERDRGQYQHPLRDMANLCLGNIKKGPRVCLSLDLTHSQVCMHQEVSPSQATCGFG